MKYLTLILKGFLIGLGKIIPGISGATLAISLGVYENGIKAISQFFKEPKKYFLFLFPIAFGIGIAIILGSKAIIFFLEKYYLSTMLLFIGFIIGGIPYLLKLLQKEKKEKGSILIFLISLIFVFSLSFLTPSNNQQLENQTFTTLFLIGLIEAATMVIPGISGTAILMILGYYNILIKTLGNLNNINLLINNLNILFPFGLGIIIGTILISKMMNKLFSYQRHRTYSAILGFSLGSVGILYLKTIDGNYNISSIVIGILLLILGYNLSKNLDN